MFRFPLQFTVPRALTPVIHALRSGAVVVLPTDTIYGLSARIDRPRALGRIAAIKGRDAAAPFLVLVAHLEALADLTPTPPPARAVSLLWPGPVTVLLPAREGLAPHLVGPSGTVAVRWPEAPFLLAILEGVGQPIVSTSINRRGLEPLCDPEEIAREFGSAIDVLVDDGPTRDAVASTVVDLTRRPPAIVRQGRRGVDLARLERALSDDPRATTPGLP